MRWKKSLLAVSAAACIALGTAAFVPVVSEAAEGNLVQNGDFENKLTGWTVTGSKAAADLASKAGDVRDKGALHYWLDQSFEFKAEQTLQTVPDGIYTLSCWTQGGGGEESVTLYAVCNGTRLTAAAKNDGWNKWHQWTVPGIAVTGGQVTVGVSVVGNANNWGSVDDITLVPQQ